MLCVTTANTNGKHPRIFRCWPAALLLMACSFGSAAATAEEGGKGYSNDESTGAVAPRVRRGFTIKPVPLNLKGKNRALVGLGSYLVNGVGGCNDCHTSPAYETGGNPFNGEPLKINTAGYLAGGGIFGPFISPNITPDASGLPGGLTRKQFISLMRTGKDPDDSSKILQVMPWPIYGNMTYLDLAAIYEYLSAVPPLPNNY